MSSLSRLVVADSLAVKESQSPEYNIILTLRPVNVDMGDELDIELLLTEVLPKVWSSEASPDVGGVEDVLVSAEDFHGVREDDLRGCSVPVSVFLGLGRFAATKPTNTP